MKPREEVVGRAGAVRLATRTAAWCRSLSGWRRHLAAAVLGALAAAALPPIHAVPVLLLAFPALLWLLDGVHGRGSAFLVGWSFGFGHFVAGLYWIGIAMTVDLARFGWFMPISVGGLSAGLAIFTGAVTLLVHLSAWRGVARVLLFAAAWLAAEFLRAILLTGFPWNLIGTVWGFSEAPMQAAALFGVWGLSLMTVVAAVAPAALADGGPAARRFVAVMLLGPVLLWIGGGLRLMTAPPIGAQVHPDILLRLVQPSIDQSEKWDEALRIQHVLDQVELSRQPGGEAVTHVIWAETAVPFFLEGDPDLQQLLADVAPRGAAIVGAPSIEPVGSEGYRLFNSIHVLGDDGVEVNRYDKFHLVPFGEYVPLRGLLGMAKITPGTIDFTPGPGLITWAVPGLPPASPLICYEVIFSGRVTAATPTRPEWLLNLTNDAWFGRSSGPYQHFSSARLRSVEEGLPLVRVANNGISAVVDPWGRLLGHLALDEVGVLDSPLPLALERPTPYAVLGRWTAVLLFLATLFSAFLVQRSGAGGQPPKQGRRR